jgi:hypothetical protein
MYVNIRHSLLPPGDDLVHFQFGDGLQFALSRAADALRFVAIEPRPAGRDEQDHQAK